MSIDTLIEIAKKFSLSEQIIQQSENDRLLFIEKFPLITLKDLSIDEYCAGTDENSFCYWLEFKKIGFGIGGGNASKFGIYTTRNKGDVVYANSYGKNKTFLDDKSANEYYSELLSKIVKALEFAKNDQIELIRELKVPIWNMVLQKILSHYFPEKFLTIGSPDVIIKCAKELGLDAIDLSRENSIQINYECKKTLSNSSTFSEWPYHKIGTFVWQAFEGENEKSNSENSIYEILFNAKPGVEKAGFNYKSLSKNSKFVWVEDSNKAIGRKPAHYEFISRKGVLYLELHFEEDKSRALFYEHIKELPTRLEWFNWMGSKSIRHKNSYKLDEVNISARIVEDLIEFHKLIGNQVRSILINQSRKFWLYAPGEKARKWHELYASGQFAIGWDNLGLLTDYETKDDIEKALIAGDSHAKRKYNDALACYEFASVVQPGDIIIAKKGKREYVGWGVVTGDYFYDDAQEEYKNRRPIDWKTNGEWLDVAGDIVTKTLTDITKYPDYVERLSKLLKIELNETASENIYMEYPLNTILYGPPGTGKTYNTILRSAEIIENRKIDSYVEALKIFKDNLHNRIEFITFHQNYSYEDFIQGLRPETDNKSSLTFDKKDGVFKKIAEKALENLILSEKAPEELNNEALFDNALEIFKEIVEESDANYPINETAYIMEVEEDAFRYTGAKWTNHANGLRMKFSDLKEFYKNGVKNRKDIKHLSNISGTAGQHKTYYFLVYEKIIKLLPKKIDAPLKVDRKNYVIVIDEINRANISRVFGELITLIEPDKRSHGEIPLEAKLPSGDNFIVPSNLYIIGTMNTADKSIALLDIALRRRFEFEAMYPKYEIEGKEIYDVDILKKINQQIITSKGHDFQIGHSYFMEENKDLIQRMNKKVIPLLLEYYMNDEKEVKNILINAGLHVEENSWPIKITGKRA